VPLPFAWQSMHFDPKSKRESPLSNFAIQHSGPSIKLVMSSLPTTRIGMYTLLPLFKTNIETTFFSLWTYSIPSERSSSNASSTSSNGSWLVLTSEPHNRRSSSSSSTTPQIAPSTSVVAHSKVFRPISNVDAERHLFLRRARDC
jgi:hypothetical protein